MSGAGDLRERLLFQSQTLTPDDYGNEVLGWTDEFERSAEVKALKGGESVMASRLEGTQPVVIRVRNDSETRRIVADWRATDIRTGALYQLKSPAADMTSKRAYFDILAESGVAA